MWFGNQSAAGEENPVYGTARTLLAYRDLDQLDTEPAQRAMVWLVAAQNRDGGWGGDGTTSSLEETALAVQTLASAENLSETAAALGRGVAWLVDAVQAGKHRQASPIGFYFAKLWYDEKLYPLIFSVGALGAAVRRTFRSIPPAAAGGLD